MKFIQLLTVFTVLASSSIANAQQKSCEQAGKKADRIVQRIFDGDCDNALDRDFTQHVNRIRDRKFPRNARNWRDRQYNNCGRDAIKTELNRIGRQCGNSHHAAKDCNELGNAAADNIVHEYGVCPVHYLSDSASSSSLQKFRHECRSVAYGKCEGFITNAVRKCGGDPLRLHKLSHLQNKCKDEVDSLTGYGEDDAEDFMTNAQFFSDTGSPSEDGASTSDEGYETSEDSYYETWRLLS